MVNTGPDAKLPNWPEELINQLRVDRCPQTRHQTDMLEPDDYNAARRRAVHTCSFGTGFICTLNSHAMVVKAPQIHNKRRVCSQNKFEHVVNG